jgi:hypothetical protein
MFHQFNLEVIYGDEVTQFSVGLQTTFLSVFNDYLKPLWHLGSVEEYSFDRQPFTIDETPLSSIDWSSSGISRLVLLPRPTFDSLRNLSAQYFPAMVLRSFQYNHRIQQLICQIDRFHRLFHQFKNDEFISIGLSLLPGHLFNIEGTEQRVEQLLQWFRFDFFKFVLTRECRICGGPTNPYGLGKLSRSEVQAGVHSVPLFVCKNDECGAVTRFVRHTDIASLLNNPEGRRQEMTQLFGFFLEVLEIESRIVVDNEDHFCSDFWCEEKGKYVHIDVIDGIVNRPLMYGNRGNPPHRLVAVGIHGVEDVTKRFGVNWDQVTANRRREISETDFMALLRYLNGIYQAEFDEGLKQEIAARHRADARAMEEEFQQEILVTPEG